MTRQFAGLVSVAMLAACASREPELAGHWKSQRSTFVVSRQGDVYTVVVDNPNGMLGGTYVGPYRAGAIRVKGPLSPVCPDIKYSSDPDRLVFCGEEFVRIDR